MVSRRFERTLRQLAPELQDVAKHYGFDRLLATWRAKATKIEGRAI